MSSTGRLAEAYFAATALYFVAEQRGAARAAGSQQERTGAPERCPGRNWKADPAAKRIEEQAGQRTQQHTHFAAGNAGFFVKEL